LWQGITLSKANGGQEVFHAKVKIQGWYTVEIIQQFLRPPVISVKIIDEQSDALIYCRDNHAKHKEDQGAPEGYKQSRLQFPF